MDPDKDNANPTIINPSDLPTRRRQSDHNSTIKRRTDGGTGLFDGLIPAIARPSHAYDPFAAPLPTLSDPSSPSDSDFDDDDVLEEIDEQEVYDLIAPIRDPEHPLTLGSLAVVNLPDINILPPSTASSRISTVRVLITPTITHCSLATVIGLGVRVRLEQALPPRFRIDVRIKEGTHSTADQVNKQLADKERVAAALENGTLMGVIRTMLEGCDTVDG